MDLAYEIPKRWNACLSPKRDAVLRPSIMIAAVRKPTHWMGPQGVECPLSLDEQIIHSSTDVKDVTCLECITALPKPECERCGGSGVEPDPPPGTYEPVACDDCGGSGKEEDDYDDNDFYDIDR